MTQSVLIFDTETTGVKAYKDFTEMDTSMPVQFYGAVYVPPTDLNDWFEIEGDKLYCKPFKPVASVKLLIQLPDSVDVEQEALNVHGITKHIAYTYGVSMDNAAHLIADLLDIADIGVAHNIDFDMRIINHLLWRVDPNLVHPEFGAFGNIETFCTMKELGPALKKKQRSGGVKWPKLSELYRFYFAEDLQNAHDAEVDAEATAEIYFAHKYFEQLGIVE